MPDLIFGTRGQAEALAAQEAVRAKAAAIRAEFGGGSNALKQWEDPVKRISDQVHKGFDPARIGKWVSSFIGVGAVINQLRAEVEDIQATIDKQADRQVKGYEAAVASGDKERAAKLSTRVKSVEAFEEAAQRAAEKQSQEFLGAKELADFDETMASLGQGYTERTIKSLGRRVVGDGGVRRADAIATAEKELANAQMMAARGRRHEEELSKRGMQMGQSAREAFQQHRENVDLLSKMLDALKAIETKEGGMTVTGE